MENEKFQYREPFFGGGSIGLSLLSNNCGMKRMWINDKDIGISCIWTSVIRYPEDLKRRIVDFIPTVENFNKIRNELIDIDSPPNNPSSIVDIGAKKIQVHQTSYSGLGTKSGGPLGGVEQKSKYKIDCRWSPDYICRKIDTLHKQFEEIDIHNNGCTYLDFGQLIEDDSCKSLLYLDPPYYEKGNDLYQNGFTESDHQRLADLLKRTDHQWILSYDYCPEIMKLYEWAKIEKLSVNYTITALKNKDTEERSSRTKTEVLITKKDK